jgi:transcriptional regulator with XRE-family HTH domain
MSIFEDRMTDAAVLEELGGRIAQLRLNLNMTQRELANRAGVHPQTVQKIEAGASSQTRNLVRVLRALELLGRLDAVVPADAPSPLTELETGRRDRTRARRPTTDRPSADKPWVWGDDE